jgi:hypothetical protein
VRREGTTLEHDVREQEVQHYVHMYFLYPIEVFKNVLAHWLCTSKSCPPAYHANLRTIAPAIGCSSAHYLDRALYLTKPIQVLTSSPFVCPLACAFKTDLERPTNKNVAEVDMLPLSVAQRAEAHSLKIQILSHGCEDRYPSAG